MSTERKGLDRQHLDEEVEEHRRKDKGKGDDSGKGFFERNKVLLLSLTGIILFTVIFTTGMAIGWAWGGIRPDSPQAHFSFVSLFTSQRDYRLLRVDVHLSSVPLAEELRARYRSTATLTLRRLLDDAFRIAGQSAFRPSGDGVVVSPAAEQRLLQTFQVNLRHMLSSLSGGSELEVLAVALYFLDEDRLLVEP